MAQEEEDEMTLSREMIQEAQQKDELCQLVREWVQKQMKPTIQELRGNPREVFILRQQFEQIRMSTDGIIMVDRPERTQDSLQAKILLPERLQGRAFHFSHSHRTAGHFMVIATLDQQQDSIIQQDTK